MGDLPFATVTPETTAYYEFLLDDNRLEQHLKENTCKPSAMELLGIFFEQANKPVTDQGQTLPPPSNLKNLTLKCLALQCGAFLKWDLDAFAKELPMSCRHQLLRELLSFCNAPTFPSRTMDIKTQISSMHDHTLTAVVLYCRWAARTVVSSAFPSKPSGKNTINVHPAGLYQNNAQQRHDEMKEQIVALVKDQCFDVVQTLESFLQQIKRAVYAPDLETIKNKQLCEPGAKGWLIPLEELHAQICYDLGCLHFMHGFYDKAYEMFGHVQEWFSCFPDETSGYSKIDSDTLKGYVTACASLNQSSLKDSALKNTDQTTFSMVMACLKKNDSVSISELGEILFKDLEKSELSMTLRDQLEQDLLYDHKGGNALKVYFDIIWSNAVCRAIRGYPQPSCLWTYNLNLSQLQRILGFVQQAYEYISRKERKKLGGFLQSLHNNLSGEQLRKELANCQITKLCVSEKDLMSMVEREKNYEESISQESPSSPADMDVESSSITDIENQVIISCDPEVLKKSITQLHKLSPETHQWKLCDRWKIHQSYESVLKSISVAISKDLMYILLAKSKLCANDPDSLPIARKMLSYIRDHGKALSFKLQKIAANELLKLEITELLQDQTLKFANEKECRELREQLSETLKRVRQHLAKTSSDVVAPPPDLTDVCVALLINLEDHSYFESLSSHGLGGGLKFCRALSKAHARIANSSPPYTDAKRAAKDLWNIVTDIFVATIYQQKRSQDNSVIILKKTDIPTPLLSRPAFLALVERIKNPKILEIILSMLIRLHRLCQEDILTEIKVPLAELWPSSLSGSQAAISAPCLANMVRAMLQHCLTILPNNPEWLRTQADMNFAYCNYPEAFRNYLKFVAVQSNYFNTDILFNGVLNTQVVKRMVKCCMQMRCNTQAAVLCQMMKDTDYSTAFKALLESRERSDAMETHYREHFWDAELLEYATCVHRDSGENAKKESAQRALANPEINVCNTTKVLRQVKTVKTLRFFRTLAHQFLIS